MKNALKYIISMMLVLSLLFCVAVPTLAAGKNEEEYLSDLRIIYADNYSEATEILNSSGLEGYKLLNANLNENTGKIGVWLAYLTTKDIEDAITDIALMQMKGGYQEGNYREMIKESYNEYLEFANNYLSAIEYFEAAYNAGDYLAEITYRQLNFYNVVTEGIDDKPDFEGELLGDIFLDGIEAGELATMFMEGNSYALSNIRSLLAMGVSYNEDGLTYLEKVAVEAERMNADPDVYKGNSYDSIAMLISGEIITFRDMFKELLAYEDELNYGDEEFTDLELKYLEHKSMAEMMRKVNYLGDKTLYDFCLSYVYDDDNYTALYPLVSALNDGQIAMTKVMHFYDVVRYSVQLEKSEDIDAEIDSLEAKYGTNPFNVYAGVDRTIYRDTFALTSAAYRADAYTESGLYAALFDSKADFRGKMALYIMGGIIDATGVGLHLYGYFSPKKIVNTFYEYRDVSSDYYAAHNVLQNDEIYGGINLSEVMDDLFKTSVKDTKVLNESASWTFTQKYDYLYEKVVNVDEGVAETLDKIDDQLTQYLESDQTYVAQGRYADIALQRGKDFMMMGYMLYAIGGIMILSSAVQMGLDAYNYYHPDYTDIPTAMVDLIDTKDGDRYIKYDVVYEAEVQKDGTYIAADLNAFQASRWNALYYTKSYEAGKPLLADEFVISNNNHTPANNYMPVHRFGETVCYNLNKYNFNETHSIYLSVKQSENQKAAVADVPEVVGAVFSTGFIFLASGIGIAAGVGGTIATQAILKKRKSDTPTSDSREEKVAD